jgi:hypothetical protein
MLAGPIRRRRIEFNTGIERTATPPLMPQALNRPLRGSVPSETLPFLSDEKRF